MSNESKNKKTGEIIDFKGVSIEYGTCTWIDSDNIVNQRGMPEGGIEILEEDSVDWEQRRYEIARDFYVRYGDWDPEDATKRADALIKELKGE